MRPCPSRRRELAELVDGALGGRDAERLTAHLVDCPGCRAEAESLRLVRARLRATSADPTAPTALTDRLLSIAGTEATAPLYARPFDLHGPGALPSRRQQTRRALVGAVTVTCLLLAGLVGAGWAAGPPAHAPQVDPGPIAREEFAGALASGPLVNPAVTGVRATGFSARKTWVPTGPEEPRGPMTTRGARELLDRADEVPFHTAFSGRQMVQVRHLAGFWVTHVDVAVHPGRGTQLTFPQRTGADRAALLPAGHAPGVASVATVHQLVTGKGPVVAGRNSTIVEARRDDRLVARWWLDKEAGMVLWHETFDRSGRITLSAGFQSFSLGPVATPRSLPPRLAPRGHTATLALSATDALQRQGWHCNRRVAGLELIKVRRDEHDPMVHTVYGDGVFTLSVVEQKGVLTAPPSGFVWDPGLRAYRNLGMTTMYSWQSGDSVFTIATDGPAELAEQALGELPHHTPILRTGAGRVVDGWHRLLGVSG